MKDKTTKEEEAAKKLNERRRKAYATDPSYRQRVRKTARNSYFKNKKMKDCKTVAVTDPVKLSKIAQPFVDVETGSVVICFTLDEIAEALGGYNRMVIYRWLREKKLPEPKLKVKQVEATRFSKPQMAFTIGEMKAICEVMKVHQCNTSCKLGKTYRNVIKRMKTEVQAVRGEINA